ncbi:head-tail connector protein [Thauera phenylacetica]|uniref:head-tail connector protein n=1 Tax=Thauera phenylacetica TaxID=164400 RepID=UPI0039E3433C
MTTRLFSIDEEAVDLAAAKLHLRVDHADEDALITQLIAAAVDMASQHTGRSIAKCTWDLVLDAFPIAGLRLLWPPVLAVAEVKYVDVAGADQVLAPAKYVVDPHSEPGRLVVAVGETWPATAAVPNAVTVRYTAGYGADCPEPIRQWILLQVGHWYRNRESINVGNIVNAMPYVDGLLDRYRVWGV